MLRDTQGLTVTTDSPAAIAAINGIIKQSLSYGNALETALLQGNAADQDCALIHAYTAAYYLSQEEAVAHQRAIPHLHAAQRQLHDLSERERWTVQAISTWATGDIKRAIFLHNVVIEKYPQDLLALQQVQYHHFYRGESTLLLNAAVRALPANAGNHYLYGMLAFGLEQCHRFLEAEEAARQAVAINRYDPWAHHAIAHVLDAQGRMDEGIAWMEHHADTWECCNSMLYTHNWWHLTLYYLAKRAFQTVLHLYDVHLWGRARKDSPKDQVGAIATLLRLELLGVDVGTRWQALSACLAPRLHEHFLPFQDLHYLYALARVQQTEQVTNMLHSMQQHAHTVHPCWRSAWVDVAIPAAKGVVAYAQGYWSEAIMHLKPVLARLHEIGGSQTQRDLFQQLYFDARLKDENRQVIGSFSVQRGTPSQHQLRSLTSMTAPTIAPITAYASRPRQTAVRISTRFA